MVKLQIAALQRDKEALLRFLQEAEVIHLSEITPGGEIHVDHSDTAYQLAQVQFALEFIGRVKKELNRKEKRSLRNLFSNKPTATLDELERALAELALSTLLVRCHELSNQMNDIQARLQEITSLQAIVDPWQHLAVSGADLSRQHRAIHRLAIVNVRDEEALLTQIAEVPTAAWQEVLRRSHKKDTYMYVEVTAHQDDTMRLDQALAAARAEIVTLPLQDNQTPAQLCKALRAEETRLQQQYRVILQEAEKLMPRVQPLQFAYDALLHRQEREVALQFAAETPYALLLNGWIPRRRLGWLMRQLEQVFPDVYAVEVALTDNEKPPVALQNSKAFEPFEAVTDIYGKPAYHELDPSPVLAVFFLIAFGLALTDAGYGFVMMAATVGAKKFFRLKRDMRKMMTLLFYAGFATVIMGALTGGWFGVTLEEMAPGTLRDALLWMKLIDPISQPMSLLGIAFAIGIVQLLFAWVVRGYDHWRTNQATLILLDDAPWISMVVLLLLWAAARQSYGLVEAKQVLLWAVLANAGYLVLTQGRSYGNPFLKIGGGVLSLYGLVSFLSDTLSYSRLLALGLATGIIGLVVNMLAGMVGGIPVIGILLAVIVLLIGHTFNLGINALGAFIHSGRLQFVEFFPKFMEGGGLPYRPLGRTSRYVDHPNDFI